MEYRLLLQDVKAIIVAGESDLAKLKQEYARLEAELLLLEAPKRVH